MAWRKKRVLVGMSGGVDSTASCLMLQEQGYEVSGLTLRTCDTLASDVLPPFVVEAQAVARRLNIAHYVADVRKPFRATVVNYFIDEYLRGRTPNPCVQCNPNIKFKVLCDYADRLECDYIATGHYSRLTERGGLRWLTTGDDERKDQSYFLWRLTQSLLSRCIFPLGELTKAQVRAFLAAHGLTEKAEEGESMEVCFVRGDYRDFLREQVQDLDVRVGGGMFVDVRGKVIGRHKGYPYYTIGQRKGLEIALGEPAYVLRLNAEKNTVILGNAEQLKTRHMLVEELYFVSEEAFDEAGQRLTVRIRYRSRPIPCEQPVKVADGLWLVTLKEEASAVAPGQSAVFYDNRVVLGGAFIASQRGIAQYIDVKKS